MTTTAASRTAFAILLVLATAPAVSADSGAQHRAVQTPPVKMGTSGGSVADKSGAYCCAGTLGAIVVRDGVRYILSNNHVLARSGSAGTGEDTMQPGLIDVGCRTTGANIVGDFAGNLVPLGTGNVDAALATARSNVDTTGAILDIGTPCNAIQAPTTGLAVMKSGRTTGLTHGNIQSINTSVTIRYRVGCNSGRQFNVGFTNQIVIGPGSFSDSGDSGSLIVSEDGTPNPVGLLFAGSSTTTIANPAQAVASAFSAGGHSFSFAGVLCSNPTPGFAPAQQDPLEPVRVVKERNEKSLLAQPGVFGVGVGLASDEADEPAVIVYVDKGRPEVARRIPVKLDGIPVRIVPTDPFVAR